MKPNQIICGDNVETMSGFPDDCIDLVVTSPPYDNLRTYGGHSWDFEGVAQQLWRVIKPGGVVVWVVADATIDGSETGTSFRQALRFKEIGFRLHDTMIWRKTCFSPGDGRYRYHDVFEFMFVLSKLRPAKCNIIRDVPVREGDAGLEYKNTTDRRRDQSNSRKQRSTWVQPSHGFRQNVWDMTSGANGNDANGKKHPATFPYDLARDHILSWSNEGDLVLDPFAGSFTTCRAAMDNGRDWIGIEVNPEYCEIGQKRLKQKVLF